MPVCSSCKEEKEKSEFTTGNRSDGTTSSCKKCMREYAREWRQRNREKELERYASYRERNKESIRDKARERMRAKRKENPEAALKYVRDYRAKNPDRVAVWDANKKSARRAAIAGDKITSREWKSIKERYSNSCVYCLRPQKKLTMDHVIPLSKGGKHSAENLVPACMSCNSSKQARDSIEWINQKHGRLL